MRGNAHVRFWRAGAGNGAGVVTRPPRPFPIRRLIQSIGKGANLFFQFVSRCYERDSIIISSNQRLGAWGGLFIWRPGEQSGIFPCCDVAGKRGKER